MKPKIIIFSILLLSITFMSSSCEKESPEDPRFSCKINGELWNPKDGNFSFGLTANYDYDPSIGRDIFTIIAAQHEHPKYIEMTVDFKMPDVGVQKFPEPHYLSLRSSNLKGYTLDTLMPYKLILKEFNKSSRLAKGEFEGYLRYYLTPHQGDSIHITEGKFNVKF